MAEKLLIDAHYNDETRIAIIDSQGTLKNFEVEHAYKRPVKGNIYLAKVERIESSIQAAFVDYGTEKHGFLPLSEIYYEFFDTPEENPKIQKMLETSEIIPESNIESEIENDVEKVDDISNPQKKKKKKYHKIHDAISLNQFVIVQAEKEIRGNKCAAFTTFVSLPGKYCVLIPKPLRGKNASVSKKIIYEERTRLQKIVEELEMPDGMGCIIRTAGQNRTKQEIKRDFEYLLRLWLEIKAKMSESKVGLIHEEGNIIKRTIRDLYNRTSEQIIIQGKTAYQEARTFMKLFTPSHVKKIKLYQDDQVPIFHKYNVEEKIAEILNETVHLPSGGTIVINQAEALTAVDVNSGKMRKERDLADTAFKTNIEAAVEIARQIQLRDISGIIVVDFIDMLDKTAIAKVEKKFKDVVKDDYSSIQIGKITNFGLMEISRQRLRASLSDSNFIKCKYCNGSGKIIAKETVAISILRKIEAFLISANAKYIIVEVADNVDSFILNKKRKQLISLEEVFNVIIEIDSNHNLKPLECKIIVRESFVIEVEKPTVIKTEISQINANSIQPIKKSEIKKDKLQEKLVNKTNINNIIEISENVKSEEANIETEKIIESLIEKKKRYRRRYSKRLSTVELQNNLVKDGCTENNQNNDNKKDIN